MRVKHVLSLEDLSKEEILQLVRRAIQMKKWRAAGHRPIIFDGLVLALIFAVVSCKSKSVLPQEGQEMYSVLEIRVRVA